MTLDSVWVQVVALKKNLSYKGIFFPMNFKITAIAALLETVGIG